MTDSRVERIGWLEGPQADCEDSGERPERPWRLVLLGAPGIGKGTQAAMICEELGACHLSTGDVFRHALTSGCEVSPAMQKALDHMKRGDLVPDETVIAMVHERAKCLTCPFGFLLDGYPRTDTQARALDEEMEKCGQKIDAVLAYELPIDRIVARLSGRRACACCKRTYHVETMPPKEDGICDDCGGVLLQRDDDRPEAIRVRMAAYKASTAALMQYYTKAGLLKRISADGTPNEVFARTRQAIESIAAAPSA